MSESANFPTLAVVPESWLHFVDGTTSLVAYRHTLDEEVINDLKSISSKAGKIARTKHEQTTRYWFDTEFMEDGPLIELLSIGIVCEDGREFYAEDTSADWSHANEWVKENVVPHLNLREYGMTRAQIAGEILKFTNVGANRPEFWAWYGDYDWVVLCQLYGTMMDLPASWPKYAMDLKQLRMMTGDGWMPEQTTTAHNALNDAKWTKEAWEYLVRHV